MRPGEGGRTIWGCRWGESRGDAEEDAFLSQTHTPTPTPKKKKKKKARRDNSREGVTDSGQTKAKAKRAAGSRCETTNALQPFAKGAAGGGSPSPGAGSAVQSCPGLGTRVAPSAARHLQSRGGAKPGLTLRLGLSSGIASVFFLWVYGQLKSIVRCIAMRSRTAPLALGKGMCVSQSRNYACREHFLHLGSLTVPGLNSGLVVSACYQRGISSNTLA